MKQSAVQEKQNRSMSNLIEYLCKIEVDKYEKENGMISLSASDIGLQ